VEDIAVFASDIYSVSVRDKYVSNIRLTNF